MSLVRTISKKIKLLPEHLIDQIKAGEVVERPAAVVKELVENSIDSSATKIEIHIVENGLELISVVDNGSGMAYEDLTYAFCRHATSKISKFEDIYSINSFGFRGEALASIASSSRVTCLSSNGSSGGKIEIFGGEHVSHIERSGESISGTSIIVRDLFYNTPVRFKFVKSKVAEKNAIVKVINGFILSNPTVEFIVKFDDKDKDIYKAIEEDSIKSRISKIFKIGKERELKDSVVKFFGEYENYKVSGFITTKGSRGKSGKNQFLLVNGRMFEHRSFYQAILKGMSEFWFPGESGHYYVNISAKPSDLDVNVHPNKTEIKFADSSIVFSLIQSSIKNSLSSISRKFDPDQKIDEQQIDWNKFSTDDSGVGFKDKANTSHVGHYQVTSQFFIVEEIGQKLLCDLYKMVMRYLAYHLELNSLVADEETSPLLISTLYEINWNALKPYIKDLKEVGIEVERVNDLKILLKTVPTYLEFLLDSEIILYLIEAKINKNNVFEDFIFDKLVKKSIKFNDNQLMKIWKWVEGNREVLNETTRLLTNSVVNEIFYRHLK